MILKKYFDSVTTPIAEVRPNVWNQPASGNADQERTFILEQYKIYVEMADRISARRSLTNTFFLTLNTAIFAGIGVSLKDPPKIPSWILVFPVLALVIQCVAWFFLVRSYRQLNAAKYTVIGVLEEQLRRHRTGMLNGKHSARARIRQNTGHSRIWSNGYPYYSPLLTWRHTSRSSHPS